MAGKRDKQKVVIEDPVMKSDVAATVGPVDAAATEPPTPEESGPAKALRKASVHAVRACCPSCGSSDVSRRQVIQDREHHAEHGETATSRRRWQRAQCNAKRCRQWFTMIEDYNL